MADVLPHYTTRSTCRICNSSNLERVLNIGVQYVNNFVEPGLAYSGIKAPIELVTCKNCSLVQNPHTVDMNLLYQGNYWYKSGTTETMRHALKDVADAAKRETSSTDRWPEIVLDIGSNDGTLLRNFPRWITIGCEPAKNLHGVGSSGVTHLIKDFWNASAFEDAAAQYGKVGQKAKVVTALGMFYDMDDPNQFVADIKEVLHPEGVFIAQLMCLKNMLAVSDFGNLAHEHLEFYTLHSLDVLFNRNGLEIYKIETNDVNGQSYRLYIQHVNGPRATDPSVALARYNEAHILHDLSDFFGRMELNKSRILEFIRNERWVGKKFWVYGASTKGNTVIQWLGLTDWEIEGAAEKDTAKFGKVMVGSNITIFPEEVVRKRNPDYCLVLPFAFRSEFINREAEQEWRLNGGKFLFVTPKLEIM